MADNENKDTIQILLCKKCSKIPEILKVNIDNEMIVIKCKKCGIFEYKVTDYTKFLKELKLNQCNCGEKASYYCYECEESKCDNCKKEEKDKKHHYIEINEKRGKKCLFHDKEDITKFCSDCQENIYSECDMHDKHDKKDISDLKQDALISTEIIKNVNENLKNKINFNQMIINLNLIKNNKIEGVDKIYHYIEEEKKRNSKQINLLIASMENKKKVQKNAIETLKNDNKIEISSNEKELSLYDKKINDKILNLISKIQFKYLNTIDLSKNKIKNIKPLMRMNLINLINLNLSINEIENIEALPELNIDNIEKINLDDNYIKDTEPLFEIEFPNLKELRIQNNKISEKKDFEDKFKEKYGEIEIYT